MGPRMDKITSDSKDRAWASAMSVIRGLGEDPDTVIREATETVEFCRNHPFTGNVMALELDEDEV